MRRVTQTLLVAAILGAIGWLAAGCVSPAGGATALVTALGIEPPGWTGARHLLAGILLVTPLGGAARLLVPRLHGPSPQG